MAVYTSVNPALFADWACARFNFTAVSPPLAISEGIENTNYRFHADGDDYVFTIFELWDATRVAYYVALTRHFAAAGLPTPPPLASGDGNTTADWEGKPCLVVPFVCGASQMQPDASICRNIGDLLARFHIAANSFTPKLPNPRDSIWRRNAADKLHSFFNDEQKLLLQAALSCDVAFAEAPLPAAACHCDLFRNNVLWRDGRVAAVIDFYFGGDDTLIYDLAVCVCDWCFHDGAFCRERLCALLDGYSSRRAFTALEKKLFADALCAAAFRFWISRHYDIHFPRRAEELTPHDPSHFEAILRETHKARADMEQLIRRVA